MKKGFNSESLPLPVTPTIIGEELISIAGIKVYLRVYADDTVGVSAIKSDLSELVDIRTTRATLVPHWMVRDGISQSWEDYYK